MEIFKEIDRPDISTQNQLWYPAADVTAPQMRTRGRYRSHYPEGAVIHFTAGRSKQGDRDAVNTVAFGANQGLCYFVISSTGRVYQSFPLDRWGHHAGVSQHKVLGKSLSKYLVGIEVCCAGALTRNSPTTWKSWFNEVYESEEVRIFPDKADNIAAGTYHKFTPQQENSLESLLIWLHLNNPEIFKLDYVLGHDEVSPGRKTDPGASLSMTMPMYRDYLKVRLKSYKELA